MSGPAMRAFVRWVAAACAIALAAPAGAQPARDAGPETPAFAEGDVIGYAEIGRLRPFLPAAFWAHRDFFFHPGMRLEIGPTRADYSPAREYLEATERFRGRARIGPDGSLEGYVAGWPFPMEDVDCLRDPLAGVKIMWNHDYKWNGDGAAASFHYSYWDRGEELPLFYQGRSRTILLAHRVEKQYLEENGGDIFPRERRKSAFGAQVEAPFDARGIELLTYRYKSSDGPRSQAQNDDTWVYVPMLRRVRRVASAQRTDAVSGTDFTFDDLGSFAGIVPQYEWECIGERLILAPSNTRVKGYPYREDHSFGPYGLSFADDRWELRDAVVVRMVPKNPDHPYHHKDIYLDKQTLNALYSFAYDQKQELWKIIWHNKRWSESDLSGDDWYPPWEGIQRPRDQRIVADIIANVQTGTGNRIEFWDSHGTPLPSRARIRRYIDTGRLTRGR